MYLKVLVYVYATHANTILPICPFHSHVAILHYLFWKDTACAALTLQADFNWKKQVDVTIKQVDVFTV